MEEVEMDAPQESSISNAVNELLTMTNAAVKKLTDPRTAGESDTSVQSIEPKSDNEKTATERNNDRRLLEILSETRESTRNESLNDENDGDQNPPTDVQVQVGKVIDVTDVLADSSKSEISILDVGGGQIDSSMSTPASGYQQGKESQSESVSEAFSQTIPAPSMFKDSVSPKQPAETMLSPIILETDAGHMEEEVEQSFALSMRKADGRDNLTSSVKTSSNSDHMSTSRGSSTVSEVLKQSTRAPKIPESARVKSPGEQPPEVAKGLATSDTYPQNEVIEINQPRSVIIKKSRNARESAIDLSLHPERDESSRNKIQISKKKMKEIRRPFVGDSPTTEPTISHNQSKEKVTVAPVRTTLSQGVFKADEDKENGGIGTRIDKDLKIIRSDIGATKKKLLGTIKSGDQYKRMVPANIVNEKAMQKRMVQGQGSDIMALAMQHTAPMLKVQQDLESQVTRLTEKLNELERQKQQEQTLKHQERSVDLERRLDELTALRLKSLEQLQEQQAAWQTQFLKVVGSMQSTQNKLNDAAAGAEHLQSRTVRFDGVKDSYDVLRTPAPRSQAPHPTISKEKVKGTSPGNAYLLKNILEQMDVSTPSPSPAVVPPSKILRDPLAEVTPVRGPTQKSEMYGVNLTSTPHADDDDRAALNRAKKNAREEAERIEITKRFPASVSDYMVSEPAVTYGLNPNVAESILKPGAVDGKPIDVIWMELKDLQTRRKILDENLAIVERGRGGEDIAAAVEYDILCNHPEINPTKAEELRLKKMVDDQIKRLKDEPTRDAICRQPGRAASQKSERSKVIGKKGRMPAALQGAKVNTGLQKNQRNARMDREAAAKTTAQRARSHSPGVGAADIVGPDTEDFVTHVYGRAAYHPRRTTVHNPYIHLKSPQKKPTFRKKKAVEVVKASMVKSARTQTTPPHGTPAQYYFTPSTSPPRPPISTSPTPGQLIPMAIPLGPPVISDAPKPVPVVIHQTDAAYTTFVVDTPEPKTIRIYNPADASHTRKPNTAVISVKGEDGPDLSIHKIKNIDIDTPDVSETTNVKEIYSPVKDVVPGSTPLLKHDKDESEGSDGSLHIELRGASNGGVPLDYHGPSFPPECPPHRPISASDIADEIDKHELEQETVRWVEQEILARILSELYPPGSQNIKDAGPVEESQLDENIRSNPGVLNPESLQLFIDAGLPIDDATINRLVEEEMTQILREMIKRPAQDQATRPKTPVSKPQPLTRPRQRHNVPTPLPTPDPSPRTSVSDKVHLHTPSLTPESSMAESLPVKDPTPAMSPEPQIPSPKVESLPKTPENVALVETPAATPPSTPIPVLERPRTPVLSLTAKSPPSTPERKLPDPWGDMQFPLPEEIHKPKPKSVTTFAPPPEAVDLVVRTVTPPPATPPNLSLSEGDTTTVSSDRGESSISEGQLLISHGEVKAKMQRGQLPGIIEDIFGEADVRRSMGLQSTLKDARDLEDFEQRSEGEIRLSMRPAMISKVIGHNQRRLSPPGDDPAGVYSHPRRPIPSETDDDLSVGEVKQDTIVNRRSKFKKWREERSPKYSLRSRNDAVRPELTASRDSPLSMDDLQGKERRAAFEYPADDSARTSIASELEESFDAKVIMVEPASKKTEKQPDVKPRGQFSVQPKDTLVSTDFQKTLASTDHSGVIKDSLEDSANRRDFFDQAADPSPHQPAMKVSLTLPTADQAASVSSDVSVSDVSEMSGAGF